MSEGRRFWYPGADGQPAGPLPADAIRQSLATGSLRPASPLCVEGTQDWRPAAEFPEFADQATSYFYKRSGLKMGPLELPELANLIRVGELTGSDVLMAKGAAEWVPIASIPSLAAALAAGAAAAKPPLVEPKAPAAAVSKPSRLKPVPYTPGAKPAAPGPYLTYAGPPVEVLALLETLKVFDEAPPPVPRTKWRLRLLLCGPLLLLGVVVALVDLAEGFPVSPFNYLVPLVSVGVLLVVTATGADAPRPNWMRGLQSAGGCLFALLAIPMGLALTGYALGSSFSVSPTAWIVAAIFGLSIMVLMDNRSGAPQPTRFELARLDDCREVIGALQHDAMPGKPAMGWLDLTGPQQGSKVMREGNAASGARIRVFRDEWWRFKLPLRDGNQLRISGVERWKVKDEVRRRRRTKPGASERISTVEVKLAVNTAAYRTKPTFAPASCGESLTPGPIETAPDSVSAQAQLKGRTRFRPQDVLTLLALVYARLEPVTPPAGSTP